MGQKARSIVTGTFLLLAALLALALTLPRLFGLELFAVTSGSMEPLYPVGSMLYVRGADPAALSPGDSVTFRLTDSVTATHQVRAVDTGQGLLYTQGIGNRDEAGDILPDAQPVAFDRVVGVPVACVPGLGALCQWLKTPAGAAVCLGALLAVLALSFLPDRAPPPGGKRLSKSGIFAKEE